MLDNSYQQDPLRSVATFSGTIITHDDIVFDQMKKTRQDDEPSVITSDVLQKLQEVSKSVRALSDNEDFLNLMWYLSQIKSVASSYAFNPTMDQAAKNTWFQQLTLVNGFENIFNDFRSLTPSHYQEMLEEHLEYLKAESEFEGAEHE